MKERFSIFGVPIDNVSNDEAKSIVENAILRDENLKIFTPNPEILLLAKKDDSFKNILLRGGLLIPDGTGLLLFSKLKERVAGVDLMLSICKLAAEKNKKIFLLGGKDGTVEKTKKSLEKKFQNINIVGISENQDACYNLIENSKPDIIFVALGAPKQEIWIDKNIEKFKSLKIAMGVGGAFDMISGSKMRAPKIMQKFGLEWLFRLLIEPKRIGRIINAVIVFSYYALKEKINVH